MELVFWVSLGLVMYVYAGYPLVLAVWSRIRRRRQRVGTASLPHVSIVLAVRNEAGRLRIGGVGGTIEPGRFGARRRRPR